MNIFVLETFFQKISWRDISPFIDLVTVYGEFVSPAMLKEPVSRDPDDDKFIATALAAKCKLIVSGDKDLLTIDGYFGIEIIKPNEFVNKYISKI